MEVRNEVASTRCDELLELDAMQFGKLVHAISQEALEQLEAGVSYARSSSAQRHSALQQALAAVASRWEAAELPPAALWQQTLAMAGVAALSTLNLVMAAYRREVLCRSGLWWRKEWRSECPFGT
jgi:hypothetical protein